MARRGAGPPAAPAAPRTHRHPSSSKPPRFFPRSLQVFSIGEEVKETNESGFLGTVPTLHTQLLADNSLLQVGRGRGV